MTVRPIPEGHHTVIPHLTVRDATKAIDFYKAAFGAEEHNRSEGPGGKIIHAELQISDSRIFLADEFGPPGAKPAGVTIHLWVTNVDEAWDKAIKAGATVKMDLMDAFWGDRYGQLADPFGHTWSMATHIEDVAPEEMKKRAEEFFSKMGS